MIEAGVGTLSGSYVTIFFIKNYAKNKKICFFSKVGTKIANDKNITFNIKGDQQ